MNERLAEETLTNDNLHAACGGVKPLTARLESWQKELCKRPARLAALVREHGSPLHLHHVDPFLRNVRRLYEAADEVDVKLGVFLARKANKCLSFVKAARDAGFGVDTASENELRQCLERGLPGERLILTAAIKGTAALSLCARHRVPATLDNFDEIEGLASAARNAGTTAVGALRLSGFRHQGRKLFSRFGFDIDHAVAAVESQWRRPEIAERIRLEGLHFHLDGYDADQRASALDQSLDLAEALRQRGHPVRFIDIGGGLPMSYLDDEAQWQAFWHHHREALLGRQAPLTYRGQTLGLRAHEGRIEGKPKVYPFFQRPTGRQWLRRVLDAPRTGTQHSLATELRRLELELRCEPGRSVLDGAGMTVARVAYRKLHHDGHWLIGLEMNSTQCRTSSLDFMLDPLLLPTGLGRAKESSASSGSVSSGPGTGSEGFLVGAYCIENELLTSRRLRFPIGVEVGDLFVFPNTAGYFMHFLESRSHQFPLANNLVVGTGLDDIRLDEIHAES
ncbi:MAG: Y4yA family PLP-dependent enzyme [Acidobacteriota bacterium]|nr:Y4yA family PLP-dependent enzyme [Acidobacteriota bacterium]